MHFKNLYTRRQNVFVCILLLKFLCCMSHIRGPPDKPIWVLLAHQHISLLCGLMLCSHHMGWMFEMEKTSLIITYKPSQDGSMITESTLYPLNLGLITLNVAGLSLFTG